MIEAKLQWRESILASIRVLGHAQASQRQLCVAVTCLLRSAAEAINNVAAQTEDALDWDLQIPTEGEFSWELRTWHKQQTQRLSGISQMLGCGLRHLSEVFPQELALRES